MSRTLRTAFTLVELLVALGIITILLTLTAVYVVPAFQDNKNVIRGLDRVTTVLLVAKQRALRDQRPVGVRFETDVNGICRTLRYVEQPDLLTGQQANLTAGNPTITLSGVDLFGSATPGDTANYNVQPGDWIRFITPPPNTSQNVEIVGIASGNSVQVRNPPGTTRTVNLFSIIRQTRPIAGEDVVELPLNVVVNLGQINALAGGTYQVPTHPVGTQIFYEIVFGPSGEVFNRSTSTPIVLWVHDETQPANEPNTARLIGVYPRTGLVGAHEVNPGPNPLLFAIDGKSSGL
jgi:prepilin-type N-terminal cleavage/methylation domain-containing protein